MGSEKIGMRLSGNSAEARSIREILELERRNDISMGPADRLANVISSFAGSMRYVWLHLAWFGLWIALNLDSRSPFAFDPFPFQALDVIIALELVFLSTFILMSQNREALKEDRQAKVDLQVNVITEQELTRLLALVTRIHEHLGLGPVDQEVRQMEKPTYFQNLAEAADQAREGVDPEGARGPSSAVDTET